MAACIPEYLDRLRTHDDPEWRGSAAEWLGEHGDARAIEPLENAALNDHDGWSVEGAFVDGYETVSSRAVGALQALCKRIPASASDDARRRYVFAKLAAARRDLDELRRLFRAFGPSGESIVAEAVQHADITIRAGAIIVRDGLEKALAHPDEEVRFEVLTRDPKNTSYALHSSAMRRLPDESSARVKRATFELWLRVLGDRSEVECDHAKMFLSMNDADVRRRVARIVLERKLGWAPDMDAVKALAREVLGASKL